MTDLRNGINTLGEEGKAAAVELHQIARKAGERVKEAEATTEKTLKLVD